MIRSKEVEWSVKEVLIPDFRLPSTQERDLGPGEFKHRRNLIVIFLHNAQCVPCQTLLKRLAASYPDVQALSGEMLVIVGGETGNAQDLHHKMQLRFPFLFDAEDRVAEVCLGAERMVRPAVLVADRYGAVWTRFIPKEEHGAIEVRAVLERLQFIELQCPECGVPDQPSPR